MKKNKMSKEQGCVLKAWEVTVRKTQQAKKRANNIFGTVSVASQTDDQATTTEENDDETSTNRSSIGELYHAEREYFLMETTTQVNGTIASPTDTVSIYGQMVVCTLVNGTTRRLWGKGSLVGLLVQRMKVSSKVDTWMGLARTQVLVDILIEVNG